MIITTSLPSNADWYIWFERCYCHVDNSNAQLLWSDCQPCSSNDSLSLSFFISFYISHFLYRSFSIPFTLNSSLPILTFLWLSFSPYLFKSKEQEWKNIKSKAGMKYIKNWKTEVKLNNHTLCEQLSLNNLNDLVKCDPEWPYKMALNDL